MGSCYSSMGKRSDKTGTVVDQQSLSTMASASPSPKRHRRKKKSTAAAGGGDQSVLLHIPGRLSANGASKIGSLYTQQGKKGTNQDAMLFWEVSIFTSLTYIIFFFLFIESSISFYVCLIKKK